MEFFWSEERLIFPPAYIPGNQSNVRDGCDMPHGHIGWLGDNNEITGKILTGNENTEPGEGVIVIQRKDSPQIDGIEDNSWQRVQSYGISNNRMPGTLPMIPGKWKMMFDNENL